MSYTISPNMFLRIPGVGSEQGPDYALDINYDLLNVIDTHDHTAGRGVQITPAGLNINTDVSFNEHFAIDLAGLNLIAQASTPALSTIYQSGVDLYFVDGVGNDIRITQSGGIAGSPGSITGLVPPASVTYVSGSQTFVFQSNVNIAANLDAGSLLLRNLSPNSTFAVTLEPPAALANNYTLTLPTVPVAERFLSLDSSGQIQSHWAVDDSTIKIVANELQVQLDNITIEDSGAQLSVRNGDREHNWELNGPYWALTAPVNDLDAIFFAPYNITITQVWIYTNIKGASGTTEFDLKARAPGGAWASILSTTGKVTVASTAITSLTSSGTTATATLANHGFSTGDTAVISGATQPNYNGSFAVTVLSSSQFTYTMVGSAVSPATGSPVVNTPATGTYTDSGSIIGARIGVTKPVLSTTAISAGTAIRFDLLQLMASPAEDARIRIYYKQA